jgi:cell division protein FtsI (penicillin-binding protein 3)
MSSKSRISGVDFDVVQGRVKFSLFFIFILVLIYLGRIFFLKFEKDEVKPKNQTILKSTTMRNNIVDRNGNILATSIPVTSIAINAQKIINLDDTLTKLSMIFPDVKNDQTLIKNLNLKKKFVWIKRNITPKQEQKLNQIGVPGIIFEKDYKRVYPYKNIASFITGYVDVDQNGVSGIEKSYNSLLDLNQSSEKELALTIDIRLQSGIDEVLREHIKKTSAEGGLVVVSDITNGEILAMSSYPNFDPNHPHGNKPEEMFNRATLGIYELGSVFKIVTVASALDSKSVKLTDTFDVTPPLRIGKHAINDFISSSNKIMNPEMILAKSSNIGTAKMALRMGIDKQKEYLDRFGMFKIADVGLYEKGRPIWPKVWKEVNSVTISYGHGFAVTPIHLIQAVSGILNKGSLCNPHIGLEDDALCKDVISEDISMKMRKLLRNVVLNGGGKKANVDKYCVGGKSGTSSKIHNGRYIKSESITSFVGVLPMYNPKYIVFVSVDNPKGNRFETTGGAVSAPIVHDVIERMIPIFDLLPEEERCFFD